MLDPLVILAVVLAVAVFVSAPLRGGRAGVGAGTPDASAHDADDLAELEAAKEAKYREIRDAELDYRTGKLSEQDWRELDGGLRGEAVVLLKRLDEVRDRVDAVG